MANVTKGMMLTHDCDLNIQQQKVWALRQRLQEAESLPAVSPQDPGHGFAAVRGEPEGNGDDEGGDALEGKTHPKRKDPDF